LNNRKLIKGTPQRLLSMVERFIKEDGDRVSAIHARLLTA